MQVVVAEESQSRVSGLGESSLHGSVASAATQVFSGALVAPPASV